jgi:hypothetical protein
MKAASLLITQQCGAPYSEVRWSSGPVHELPERFRVLEFEPGRDMRHWNTAYWIYATRCMSEETDDLPIELHLFSPFRSEEPVELLTITAYYHRTGRKLGLGHTVNFGKPWIGRSACEFGLISLPYLDGPALENMLLAAKIAKFYWLIPITEQERNYIKEHGLSVLEQKFEESNFNYADVSRCSVLKF